jgi:hypothetical protein
MNGMTISVLPIEAGWMVRHEPGGEHLVFLSGGRAEAAARRVAEAASVAGTPAELQIHTRDGDAVYRFRYAAA